MKIVHFIPTLGVGGGERLVSDLCAEQSKHSEVSVIYLLKTENVIYPKIPQNNIFLVDLYKLGFFRSVQMLRSVLKSISPDVLHVHLGLSAYAFVPWLFLHKKPRMFYTFHTIAEKDRTSRYEPQLRGLLIKLGIVSPIAVSLKVAESIQLFYRSKTLPSIITNGAPCRPITPLIEDISREILEQKSSRTRVFIFVGRLVRLKCVELLINAFNSVNGDSDHLLIIVGDDPVSTKEYFHELQSLSTKRVLFMGHRDNVQDYLSLSDYFCISSEFEGLPISLLEALSYGLIPISTPVGEVVNVINDNNIGFLSQDHTIGNYSTQLKSALMLSDDALSKMKLRCKEVYTEKYSIEQCASNLQLLYEGLN